MARRALLRDKLPLVSARVALPDLGWGDPRELGRSADLLAMAAPWLTDALTWGYVPRYVPGAIRADTGARLSPAEFLARISTPTGACHGVRVFTDNAPFAPIVCGGAATLSGNAVIGAVWAATNHSEPQVVIATYKIRLAPSIKHVNAEIVGGDMASYTLFLVAVRRLQLGTQLGTQLGAQLGTQKDSSTQTEAGSNQ